MYNIIKTFNAETLLAEKDGRLFVLKRISLDEVEIVKKLMTINSENVVRFYETVVIDEKFYAVEEFINGDTLKRYIETNGPLSDDETKNITVAICRGLSEVHARGVVHRDINPNNIMLDNYGVVKIIDFGISRTYKPEKRTDTQILGTQGYAAPEQYGFGQTGSRADIYSLGVLINYMKTGALPNEKQAQGNLGEVVKKCTCIDENGRYGSVDEVIADVLYGTNRSKSVVPGFRKKIWWHKTIAIAYYIFFFIAFIAYVIPDAKHPPAYNVYWVAFVILVVGAPVPVFTDFLGWSKRLGFFKDITEKQRRFVPIVTGVVYEIIAFLIFIIIDSPQ